MAVLALVIASLALVYSIIKFNHEYRARRKADLETDKYRADLESSKAELEKTNLQLKELQDLEKFTSTGRIARTIAHEVRNPLTNILLATEQLRETETKNEETPVLLDLINRNAARINQLVSDLLNATRFSQLDFSDTDINQLMEETLVFAKDRVDLNEIRVEKEYLAANCKISIDKEKMKVALLNIIVNAIESMEKGKGVLQLSTRSGEGKCIIEIRDNGKGIDEEGKARLFEPYFTTKMKGNGLGLTNTQNIILNHNGSIRVQSIVGKGTCFSITLDVSEHAASQKDRKNT
jgi:signal transduction histidine kinase